MEVADGFQAEGKGLRSFQAGEDQEIVALPDPAVFLINGADLPGDGEIGAALLAVGAVGQAELRAEAVEAVSGGDQLFLELLAPGGVGEVSGAQDGNALAAGPEVQGFGGAVPAGGPGVAGVDVQVGEKHGAAPFVGVFFYHTAFSGELQEVKSI